jgi:1A family penicillin-binding protein
LSRYRVLIKITGIVLTIVGLGLFIYEKIISDFPNINEIYNPPKMSTIITDRNGKILYKFYNNENRSWVPFEKIPDELIKATLAIEDKEFYKHHGISIKGILRSVWYNLRHKNSLHGGSTITQQLVKNIYLNQEKTLSRKIKEAIIAFIVERRLTKNEILERYFNQVNYGGEVYGAQEAAMRYFGKNVWEINLAQATYLAGKPAAPSVYNSTDEAKKRQNIVINEMVKAKYISPDVGEKIKNEELNIENNKTNIVAPHFVFYVRDLVKEKYGFANIERQGLKIITSIDSDIQRMAEKVTKEEIQKVKRLNITNGAVLVLDVKNGDILAMVGSVSDDFNVVTALRQPGSSIKPINYLLALKRGKSLSSIIDDSPVTYFIKGQKPYSPQNYTGKYFGPVTLKTALASSLNIPSVKLLDENGVENMIELAKTMGINTWEDKNRFGLSLALGSGEVKMIELASAYSIFANLGDKIDINPINEIQNYLGENVYQKIIRSENVIESGYAYLINSILIDDEARAPIFGRNSLLNIKGKTVAVKTGTTNNLRDNWCIGWTPSYLVAVWVGNNNNSQMTGIASGISGATPIWHRIMSELLSTKDNEIWAAPGNVYKANVCGKEEYHMYGTEKNIKCATNSSTLID